MFNSNPFKNKLGTGKNHKKVLAQFMKEAHDTYHEDNFNTTFSFIVKELLLADSEFIETYKSHSNKEAWRKTIIAAVTDSLLNEAFVEIEKNITDERMGWEQKKEIAEAKIKELS